MFSKILPQHVVFTSLLVICVSSFVSSYYTLENTVTEQSRIQQNLVSSILILIDEHLSKPLHTAETLEKTELFLETLKNPNKENIAKLRQLIKKLERNFGLKVFVAIDKLKIQLNSDSDDTILDRENAKWYYKIRNSLDEKYVDIGRKDDPQLYIDIKVYDENENFLGIIGVFKELRHFINSFKNHRNNNSYDFIFISRRNQIMLSSNEKILENLSHPILLNDIPKISNLVSQIENSKNNSSLLIMDGKEYLSTLVSLPFFEWRMLLLIPLDGRKKDVTEKYFNSILFIVLSITVTAIAFLFTIYYFRSYYKRKMTKDILTSIGNRMYLSDAFNKVKKNNKFFSLVIADIDNFKKINDEFGHNAGDKVIQRVANILTKGVRNNDVVGRWGGEEFLLILPQTELDIAFTIVDRIRLSLASEDLHSCDLPIKVTASFGITFCDEKKELSNLIEEADKALYDAKNSGKNIVKLYSRND